MNTDNLSLSPIAQQSLEELNTKQLHYIIVSVINVIVSNNGGQNPRLSEQILNELLNLDDFYSYELIKACCDRCQALINL